jgi:1-acyl-sn-glycerol-3-phosphate acyltransferase
MLRTILTYIFIGAYIAIAGPIALLWTLFSGNGEILFSLAHFCMRVAGWMCGVRVEALGKEHVIPGQAYLFLSNHQGNFDGPVLFYATKRNLRAVIKKEMMSIPLFSRVLRVAQFVAIDRSDPIKARAGIERATQLLKGGLSFFAFPEGTRTRTGQLGVFKKGVFVMAINAGVPVMPVTICNSRAIQPPGRFAIKPGTIRLVFHHSIPTDQMTHEDRDRLLQLTQAAIAKGLSAAAESSRQGTLAYDLP